MFQDIYSEEREGMWLSGCIFIYQALIKVMSSILSRVGRGKTEGEGEMACRGSTVKKTNTL